MYLLYLKNLYVLSSDIKDLYEMFDIDKSGSLSFKELRKALQILGLNPTVKDVKEIMKKNDVGPNSKSKSKCICFFPFL